MNKLEQPMTPKEIINMTSPTYGKSPLHQCVVSGTSEEKCTQFFETLIGYSGVDFGYVDKFGYNVVHAIMKGTKVYLMDILMDRIKALKIKEEEWKKYFTAETKSKQNALHVAIYTNRSEMVSHLQMMEKEYGPIFDWNAKSSLNQTPMEAALPKGVKMCKLIFNENHDNSAIIGRLLDQAIAAVPYDEEFMKKLLTQSNIDGSRMLTTCIKFSKYDLFKEVLQMNAEEKFHINADVKKIWMNIGYYPNSEILKVMLETKLAPFVYSQINDDYYYWKPIQDLCINTTKWSKTQKDNEVYKCFDLLLKQQQIQNIILKQKKKPLDSLQKLIEKEKLSVIQLFFDMIKKEDKTQLAKFSSPLEVSSTNPDGYNLLMLAIKNKKDQIVKVLLDEDVFDINAVGLKTKQTAILLGTFYCFHIEF